MSNFKLAAQASLKKACPKLPIHTETALYKGTLAGGKTVSNFKFENFLKNFAKKVRKMPFSTVIYIERGKNHVQKAGI